VNLACQKAWWQNPVRSSSGASRRVERRGQPRSEPYVTGCSFTRTDARFIAISSWIVVLLLKIWSLQREENSVYPIFNHCSHQILQTLYARGTNRRCLNGQETVRSWWYYGSRKHLTRFVPNNCTPHHYNDTTNAWDLRCSRQRQFWLCSFGSSRCVDWLAETNVSKTRDVSFFRAEVFSSVSIFKREIFSPEDGDRTFLRNLGFC
jgi:hypothetical protein